MMATKAKTSASLLLILSTTFFSCAKIKVTTPSARFITPEAQGKLFSGSGRVEQQSGSEGTLDFSGDKTDNPMEFRNNVSSVGLALDLGLLDQLDFILKGNADAATVYTLKYQFLGKSRKDASKGNQSLAATLGYGTEVGDQSEDDTSIFNSSSDDISAEIENQILEMSLIYGYRPHQDTLVYSSVQATKHDINFELETKNNAALNGKKFSLNTWAYGASVGAVRYFEKYYLNLEVSAQKTDWTNNDPMTFAFINLALGYKWD